MSCSARLGAPVAVERVEIHDAEPPAAAALQAGARRRLGEGERKGIGLIGRVTEAGLHLLLGFEQQAVAALYARWQELEAKR